MEQKLLRLRRSVEILEGAEAVYRALEAAETVWKSARERQAVGGSAMLLRDGACARPPGDTGAPFAHLTSEHGRRGPSGSGEAEQARGALGPTRP